MKVKILETEEILELVCIDPCPPVPFYTKNMATEVFYSLTHFKYEMFECLEYNRVFDHEGNILMTKKAFKFWDNIMHRLEACANNYFEDPTIDDGALKIYEELDSLRHQYITPKKIAGAIQGFEE